MDPAHVMGEPDKGKERNRQRYASRKCPHDVLGPALVSNQEHHSRDEAGGN